MGMQEPPTIADMENEINQLAKEIKLNKIPPSGHFSNRTPKTAKKKQSTNIWLIGGILLVVVLIIAGIAIYFLYCRSDSGDRNAKQVDSDTSIGSKMAEE